MHIQINQSPTHLKAYTCITHALHMLHVSLETNNLMPVQYLYI